MRTLHSGPELTRQAGDLDDLALLAGPRRCQLLANPLLTRIAVMNVVDTV